MDTKQSRERWSFGVLEFRQHTGNSGRVAASTAKRTANIAAFVCRESRRSGSSALPTKVGLTCWSAQTVANQRSDVRNQTASAGDQIGAPASWSAAALCRFVGVSQFQHALKSTPLNRTQPKPSRTFVAHSFSFRPEWPSSDSPGQRPGYRGGSVANPARAEHYLESTPEIYAAPSGLTGITHSSQGVALGYRIAPRWGWGQIVAPASWSAAVPHFLRTSKSARALAQSKTSRRHDARVHRRCHPVRVWRAVELHGND